jgi:lysophospholipase L1-like esterase
LLPVATNVPDAQIADKDTISIVALGDSLTAGTGDTTGKGYVQRVREKLEAQTGKKTHVLNNLAIPGYRSGQLLADLQEKATKDAVKDADIVLFTIGANDIFQGGRGLIDDNMELQPDVAAERVKPTLTLLEKVAASIHDANPKATVMYIGLYYPFLDLDQNKAGIPALQSFNDGAFRTVNRYPNMVFVPTYDLFERLGVRYLYTDHFHPNGDGYERIANRIAQILK